MATYPSQMKIYVSSQSDCFRESALWTFNREDPANSTLKLIISKARFFALVLWLTFRSTLHPLAHPSPSRGLTSDLRRPVQRRAARILAGIRTGFVSDDFVHDVVGSGHNVRAPSAWLAATLLSPSRSCFFIGAPWAGRILCLGM